jgi:thioesterase domain-containing protein
VYGLQAVGLADERPPLDTIEAMATHYITELRTVQPHGPYVLGGWSLGGIVAFEMAHQLQTQGETVARLILIDTFRPNPAFAAVDDEATLLRRFLADVQGQREAKLLRDNGHDLPIDSATTLAELLDHPDVASLLPPGIPPAHLHSWWQVFCANMHALHRYDPAPYAGPVTLVYATDQEDDAAATWQGFAPQMECVPMAGDHYTMMREPQVQVLAALVRDHHKPETDATWWRKRPV